MHIAHFFGEAERDLSPAHMKRLTEVMKKLKRFTEPIVVVRSGDGYWTPNGNHRRAAMKKLAAEAGTAATPGTPTTRTTVTRPDNAPPTRCNDAWRQGSPLPLTAPLCRDIKRVGVPGRHRDRAPRSCAQPTAPSSVWLFETPDTFCHERRILRGCARAAW